MRSIEAMKAADLMSADPASLVDIRDVDVDASLEPGERLKAFIERIKNPYLFKCGDMIVKLTFSDTETSLDDCVKRYLATL